jgi:hypothetical protein
VEPHGDDKSTAKGTLRHWTMLEGHEEKRVVKLEYNGIFLFKESVHLAPPSLTYANRATKIAQLQKKDKMTSKDREMLGKLVVANKKEDRDIEGKLTRWVIKALDHGYWVLSIFLDGSSLTCKEIQQRRRRIDEIIVYLCLLTIIIITI